MTTHRDGGVTGGMTHARERSQGAIYIGVSKTIKCDVTARLGRFTKERGR
jgi:hypothetical protein